MSIGAISGSYPDLSVFRSQFQKTAESRFDKDDTDKSGGLSIEEFTEALSNGPQGPANISGKPSAEELFSRLDKNGDGQISLDEFKAAKPSSPSGNLSPETLASLLTAQEQSSGTSILDLLQANSSQQDDKNKGSNVIDKLLNAVTASDKSQAA